MTLKDGLRVAKATPEQQQKIARLIDRDVAANKAVRHVLGPADARTQDATAWQRRWRDVIRTSRQLLKDFEASRNEILPEQRKGLGSLLRLAGKLAEEGFTSAETAVAPSTAVFDPVSPGDGDDMHVDSVPTPGLAKKMLRVVPRLKTKAG